MKFFILFFLLIVNCFSSVLLKNEEIMEIHEILACNTQQAYNESALDPKYHNIGAVSIHFTYKKTDEIKRYISKEPFILKKTEVLIATSEYTENVYSVDKHNSKKILSWPFFKDGRLRDKNNTALKNNKGQHSDTRKKLFGDSDDYKRCAEALNLTEKEYIGILKNPDQIQNPFYSLKNSYQYDKLEDMKHAEPLLIWWIEKNYQTLKSNFIEKIKENEENVDFDSIYPIINLHTRRQTCPKCETLIQNSAYSNGFVPIISFSEFYPRKEFFKDSKAFEQSGTKKFMLPFSILKQDFFRKRQLSYLKNQKDPINSQEYFM